MACKCEGGIEDCSLRMVLKTHHPHPCYFHLFPVLLVLLQELSRIVLRVKVQYKEKRILNAGKVKLVNARIKIPSMASSRSTIPPVAVSLVLLRAALSLRPFLLLDFLVSKVRPLERVQSPVALKHPGLHQISLSPHK